MTETRPETPPQPQKKPPNITGIIGVVILAGIGLIWYLGTHHGGSGTTYQATVTSYSAVNPADLDVAVEVTNTGSKAGTPTCTIKASDASGAYNGFDQAKMNGPLAAGASSDYSSDVTITSQGASYVTDVTATCS